MIAYENNILMCENVDIKEIAEIYGTPFYIYSKNDIFDRRWEIFERSIFTFE
ncbi:hypothetical protein OFR22_05370 [Brachyspira hyodysenteriae]|uniref:hypothetical protein n=1 Tax=Brachyspira hyodysenteriae TaxID=159 RepID=UPI0022CDD09B|nr:hypothetical protein [Brachyspira hyodysenteriae]MCZ9994806.1 hypothetical protein [Brachyspira hyodysenteriae]